MKLCPTWYHEINKMKTELRHRTVATVYLWYIYSVCVYTYLIESMSAFLFTHIKSKSYL